MHRASGRLLAAVTAIAVVAGHPAAAQDPGRVSVGAGAGLATPFHGDFGFTAAAWQADVRVDTAKYVGFAVFFEEWRHREEDVFTDQPISGPTGLLGRAERITARAGHRTRVLGWSLLARGTASRVTLGGGGGVSYLAYSREFRQTMSGCTPASLCADSGRRFGNGSFAAQLQGGADVRVATRLAVMAQFRAIFPIEDPGGGHHTIVAGVRVRF